MSAAQGRGQRLGRSDVLEAKMGTSATSESVSKGDSEVIGQGDGENTIVSVLGKQKIGTQALRQECVYSGSSCSPLYPQSEPAEAH